MRQAAAPISGARSIASTAEAVLGVPVTVTNQPGNGGLDALNDYLGASDDGHTLLSIIDVYAAAYANGETGINPAEDLIPLLVGNLSVSQIYISSDEQRFSTWDEVVAYDQSAAALTIASAGAPLDLEGLSILGLEQDFEVDLERVLIQGTEARFDAPIIGTTDLLIEQPSDVKELVDNGELVPILTLANERISSSEDVPTAIEKGAEFAPLLRIRGLAAHEGIPIDRLAYLKAALKEAFNSDEFQANLRERSLDQVTYPTDAVAAFSEQVETYAQLYLTLSTTEPSDSQRVLIIHSYADSFQWTHDQGQGIVDGLKQMGFNQGAEYILDTFFMDTRVTYTSPDQIAERAALALQLIDSFGPDLVFVTDDAALREVAVVYTEQNPEQNLPFIFSGINVDPSIYGPIASLAQPGGPITGALERIPYKQAFELGKQVVPGSTKIVLLADPASSSTAVVDAFQAEYLDKVSDSPLQVLAYIQPPTFTEWQQTVTEYQTKADLVGILNFHQVRDEAGNIVPPQDVVDWMFENSTLPELGLVSGWAQDGLLAAAGNSGVKTGIYVGSIGGQVLEGTDPASVPIVAPNEIDITFNLARAQMLDIEIPEPELEEASALYQEIPDGS